MVGVKITTSSYLHSFGESVLHDTQKIGKRFSPKVSSGAAMRVSISPTPTPFLVAVLVPSDVVVDAQCASHCCITVTALRNKEGAIGSDRSGDNRPLRDGRRGTIMCHRSTHDRIDGRCKQARWLYFGLLLLTMLSLCLPTMEALAQTPVLYYTLNEGIIGQPSNGGLIRQATALTVSAPRDIALMGELALMAPPPPHISSQTSILGFPRLIAF